VHGAGRGSGTEAGERQSRAGGGTFVRGNDRAPFFRKAGLGAGKSVLVNGASGAVGTPAIQLAKHFGAEVTAVCSGRNAARTREPGSDLSSSRFI
jgi:NADPH:quinone reductase-like Zn-dependent oxidoreductase